MAIEILDQGATRVMGSAAERLPDAYLTLGVQSFDVGVNIGTYDTQVAPPEFVGMLSTMIWPDGSGGRSKAIYPVDVATFALDAGGDAYGMFFAVFKVTKANIPVSAFVP